MVCCFKLCFFYCAWMRCIVSFHKDIPTTIFHPVITFRGCHPDLLIRDVKPYSFIFFYCVNFHLRVRITFPLPILIISTSLEEFDLPEASTADVHELIELEIPSTSPGTTPAYGRLIRGRSFASRVTRTPAELLSVTTVEPDKHCCSTPWTLWTIRHRHRPRFR